jgi:hypothetical protein
MRDDYNFHTYPSILIIEKHTREKLSFFMLLFLSEHFLLTAFIRFCSLVTLYKADYKVHQKMLTYDYLVFCRMLGALAIVCFSEFH